MKINVNTGSTSYIKILYTQEYKIPLLFSTLLLWTSLFFKFYGTWSLLLNPFRTHLQRYSRKSLKRFFFFADPKASTYWTTPGSFLMRYSPFSFLRYLYILANKSKREGTLNARHQMFLFWFNQKTFVSRIPLRDWFRWDSKRTHTQLLLRALKSQLLNNHQERTLESTKTDAPCPKTKKYTVLVIQIMKSQKLSHEEIDIHGF